MFHLVMFRPLPPEVQPQLDARKDVRVTYLNDIYRAPPANEKLAAAIADADGVMIRLERIDEALLQKAPKLKVVSRYGVGYDLIDVEACTRHGVYVGVLNGTNDVSVSEHTMMLMLSVARRIIELDASVRAGSWIPNTGRQSHELVGKRVLSLGFSRIGSRVARLCRAFGMDVYVSDPAYSELTIAAEGFKPVTDVMEALPAMDIVSLHCPLLPSTRKMVDARFLQRMKKTAWLINTARGAIVDEEALFQALSNGTIEAAGLDVLAKEPASRENPLFGLSNIVFTPHSATHPEECDVRMAERGLRNMLDVIDGRPDPRFIVNPELIYRR